MEKKIKTDRQTYGQMERLIFKEKQTDKQMWTNGKADRERQTDGQMDRHMRKTDRQTDGQMGRQIVRRKFK
jgi:hypothetical protein